MVRRLDDPFGGELESVPVGGERDEDDVTPS
jgi:hypothetical protein